MRVLLVHQNFPGQFKHLGPALVARGDEVVAMGMRELGEALKPDAQGRPSLWGMRYIRSQGRHNTTTSGHPWARDFDSKVIRGAATLDSAIALKAEGFEPDVILAHPAWGEAMFLKEVWPDARLALYCEMMYRTEGLDTGFDPEFPSPLDGITEHARLILRALPQTMLWEKAVGGLCPTQFQADTFRAPMADKIRVIHDGIDTTRVSPAPAEEMRASTGHVFRPGDEIITFVNRNLEPMRGYHRFMRALPALLRRRPDAQVILVGGEDVSYGARPAQGTWKQRFLDEVKDDLDLSRIHFAGWVPYDIYLNMLRLSKLHVYLTYPFVASWSLLEAMAVGLPVLGSATGPVQEFIRDGENGMLVDFFDGNGLVDAACTLLEDRALAARLGAAARQTAVDHYDLATVCLPRQLAWLDEVARG